jgi:ABC-type sugar transport system substrate-binding protein
MRRPLATTAILLAGIALALPAERAGAAEIRIGLSQPNLEHPYRVGGTAHARAWAEERPDVELIVVDGRRNSSVQLDGLEDLLVRNIDVILISPNDSDALAPIAAAAQAQGVPIVVFDRRLNVPEDMIAAYVGADNVDMGRVAGRFIAEHTGGQGTVIQIEGTPGASATVDRKAGFEEVIAQHPGIRIVSYVGHFRTHEAAMVMEDAITAHPDLVAVYNHNDSMALGAAQILAERGLEGIPVVGMDGAAEACEGIGDGRITASVYYPTMFPEALDVAMDVLDGKDVPKETMLETPMITAANMADFCS